MSVAIYPDEGEPKLLDLIRDNFTGWTLRLFKSNTTPTQATVLADLTQADFSGYVAVALVNGDFPNPPTEVSNKAVMLATAYKTFTHNGGATANTVYGAYIEDGTKIILAERFDAAVTMSANNDKISYKPNITLNSEN